MSPLDMAWLTTTLLLAVPILLAASGELVSQRSGVMNVGLEGMMLFGAFFGFLIVEQTNSSWFGLLVGIVAGTSLAMVMALLSVTLRADQIVVGVGINLLAAGVTIFLNRQMYLDAGQVTVARMDKVPVPVLADLPVIGRVFFDQSPVVYLCYGIVPLIAWVLYRRKWGLAVRGSGELPEAVETAGINVNRVRWSAVLLAGGLSGLGGAFLSVVQVGLFIEGMTSGRGFLALAAVVFGKWHPRGMILACLLFGGADALQLRLQGAETIPSVVWLAAVAVAVVFLVRHVRRNGVTKSGWVLAGAVPVIAAPLVFDLALSLPAQLWLALPYILSLAALGGLVGRARVPSALAEPFDRKNL
ncbi:ABC transporter permease [Streptosporangium sp. NBC_01755]|uniref:ABC transporter permease n=1 Tax=unclassified Streptosporangium TaxID=2632669 RepID=UPI002DD8AD78|nr:MULTISPECIES: ABC transporter permease [unclassified Streptosporangium]WSA26596.1 ABC transporter permease [Streptosporangium sp. NBC_01810]WSD01980.1 ABC transporter permease [Streptosporangium sp. NBC_01755]